MKKLLHKNFFTLVEVLLAMGICVVGLCSVVVFFPIGANASRNASMASYAANVAEQVLDFAKFCIETDLGKGYDYSHEGGMPYIAFRYFTSKSGLVGDTGWEPDEPWNYESTESIVGQEEKPYTGTETDYLLGKIKASDKETITEMAKKFSPFSKGMTSYILTMLQTVTNEDSAKVTSQIIPYQNNVFYARFVTRNSDNYDDEDSAYSDFDCYAQLWAEPIRADNEMYPDNPNNIPYAVRLHVTVSWPADIPWESRQKRDFTMDVFKQY